MSKFMQQEPEEDDQLRQSVPSWSGFKALVFPEAASSSVLGCCPMLMDHQQNSALFTPC